MITDPDSNPDYVTAEHRPGSRSWLAVWRTYNRVEDGYQIKRISNPMPKVAAEGLARSWAAVYSLEYRP